MTVLVFVGLGVGFAIAWTFGRFSG